MRRPYSLLEWAVLFATTPRGLPTGQMSEEAEEPVGESGSS